MTKHEQIIGVRAPMPGVTYPPIAALAQYLASGALSAQSLTEALRASFARHQDQIALLGDGWTLSYAELDQLSDRAALAFARLGLAPLDRVIFQAANSRNLVIAVIGCLKAGLIRSARCTPTARWKSVVWAVIRMRGLISSRRPVMASTFCPSRRRSANWFRA